MTKNCLVIGDLNIDLILSGLTDTPKLGGEVLSKQYFIDIGGSGGIFSAVLSGLGVCTHLISKINYDWFGNLLKQKLETCQVDIEPLILKKKDQTGITINLSYKKDKYQISNLHLLSSLSLEEINYKGIKQVDHVHFSSYFMMKSLKPDYSKLITNIKKHFDNNVTFSMDTNYDPSQKWSKELYKILPHIDIFLVNEREALSITNKSTVKEAVDDLGRILGMAVIKLGSRGYLARQGSRYYRGTPMDIKFKDSTGAGDNFDAGFIFGYLNGFSTKKCLDVGNVCGAKSVEYLGGVGDKQKFIELNKLLKSFL